MQPHTEPVCRFLCRAKIKKKKAASIVYSAVYPGFQERENQSGKTIVIFWPFFLTISGQKGHQDRTVEGVRLHPILVLRVADARAGPAAHDRRPVVRCQDTQQQGRTGTLTIFAVLLQYFFTGHIGYPESGFWISKISGIKLFNRPNIHYRYRYLAQGPYIFLCV